MHDSHGHGHVLVIVGAVIAPSLHQLAVFRAVATHLNYTRAANELHLSQPAVTRQVQLLERELGVRLFARRGRRSVLTDDGMDVLNCAVRIFGLFEDLEQVLAARRGMLQGRLRVVATSTAGEYLLPSLLAGFRRVHAGIHVALRVANREQVLRALTAGEADLAVMGRPPDLSGWTNRALMSNELVAIASPDHPCLGSGVMHANDLASETFFLREAGSGTRTAVEAFLREAGVPIDDDAVLGSDSGIKQAVMAGLGISILSRQALDLELAAGRLAILPVEGLPLPRQWFLVEPADAASPATRAFSRYLLDAVR